MNQDESEITRVADRSEIDSTLRDATERTRAYLVVLAGSNVGEMFRVEEGENVLGRGMASTIRLNDDGVSRKHALLVQKAGAVHIQDLKSANGTLVNGVQIDREALHDGDKIRLGSTTILKFTYNDHLDETFQRQMYEAALRDGLTKAFNKQYFLDRLETEVAYARRHESALALLIFDVDHFKRVNDTYGHVAGDAVLARLSRASSGIVRVEDVLARYGGEEFAVICRGVALDDAGILGERLRATVEATRFEVDGAHVPVTISVGVAAMPESAVKTGPELIVAADTALYQAKRAGRNQVVLKLP
jgi:diguanylate cyclase (GGDEF)-like protein